MRATYDHPRTRAGWTCPVCLGSKDPGLVTCWPCWRSKYKHGDPKAEAMVAEFEEFLTQQERRI
jgi:hypothetical protein